MDVTEFATLVTRFIYLAIAIITLFEFVAFRDETRLDIALMFGSFAVTILAQQYAALTDTTSRVVTLAQSLPLMAQPYLLVRLVNHFQPVPRWVLLTALAGMVLSWVVFIARPASDGALSGPLLLAVVAYFVWAEVYAVLAFIRGARITSGVTRWRLTLAALGAGLVAFVIGSAGVREVAPALAPLFSTLNSAFSVASALAFYFGFAPPRWLRHTWQLHELHRFLGAAAGKPPRERADWILSVLCDTTMRAVGGRGAVAAAWDTASERFVVRSATNAAWLQRPLTPQRGAMAHAWGEWRPRLARELADMSPDGRRLAEEIGTSSLMVVPVGSAGSRWGLLVAFLRRTPLFPDDDLRLLSLFAEQAALALEQAALLNEQQVLVEDLRARTAQLEASNAELEAFSYSVSHDLRAPLRHIEGFTDLLRRNNASPEQQTHHLQRISEAAVRMGRLIDDLLTFSRMGRTDMRQIPLKLDRLVEDVRQDLAAETQGREVNWHIQPLPEVTGDPELLRLVVYNLLANAVKYTRGRSPAEIEVAAETGPHETVISVRDNGVGFDMQYADKLFGVFQRLHHADEFEGVGIGLANVRRIVNRHGGRTWAISQPGQGATFYFSLPARASTPALRGIHPLPEAALADTARPTTAYR